jgi:mycothiol synthase
LRFLRIQRDNISEILLIPTGKILGNPESTLDTLVEMHYDVSDRIEPERRPAIERLLTEVGLAERRQALSDHLTLDLRNGGGDRFVAVTAAHEAERPAIAYAQASRANEAFAVEMAIAPAERSELDSLVAGLIDRLTAAISGSGGGAVNWWIHGDASLTDVAERMGFVETRRLLQMRMPLPSARSADVATRSFGVGQDEEEWVRVNNRAFAGHGEQGGWTTDALRLRESESWFDPQGFRIHERDGRLAAFCWTKVHAATEYEPESIGEIYVIAVDPDFHGIGLGSQLTLSGLDHLSSLGITIGMLYVDAANNTAVTMYERLGYRTHTASTVHHLVVPSRSETPRSETPRPKTGRPETGR